MRLEAGRLLGKQGTPLLPLGRGQLGGSGRQRGVSLKAGHTHPFHSPFIFVLRRKPLRYELETASHLICWLPHHQEKKEIGFCTLRLSLWDTSPDDALTKAKMLWNLDIKFKSFNPVLANDGSLNLLDMQSLHCRSPSKKELSLFSDSYLRKRFSKSSWLDYYQ